MIEKIMNKQDEYIGYSRNNEDSKVIVRAFGVRGATMKVRRLLINQRAINQDEALGDIVVLKR